MRTTFAQRYIQGFEESTTGNTPGFGDISSITTNDAIEGNVSIILINVNEGEGIGLGFYPKENPFLPNTIYSVEFDYRMLKAGENTFALYFSDPWDEDNFVRPKGRVEDGKSGISFGWQSIWRRSVRLALRDYRF